VIARPLAFLLGVLVLLALPRMPHAAVIVAVAIAMPIAFLAGKRWPILRVVSWACAGWLLAAAAAHEWLEVRWPETAAGERLLVEAIVEDIPVATPYGYRFDAKLTTLRPGPGRELRARLTVRDHDMRPRAGERWQLLVALQPPRGRLNPGARDPEREWFRQRIHALGTVVTSQLNRRIDAGHRPVAALRERIAARIGATVDDRDAAALIAALAVGATGEMSREQWRVFAATGTTHLVAISGLHVTLFAATAFAAARRLWSAVLWRRLPLPRDTFAIAAGLALATVYALLAGFSVPTQRTLLMLAAWLLARALARASPPSAPLGVALVAVLLLDPLAPLASGFWLSFAAMAAIICVTRPRLGRRAMLREAGTVQLAVAVALAPLTLAWFGAVSLAGLLVNAVAIPVVSFIFVPLVLLAVVCLPVAPLGEGLLELAAWLHSLGWPWLVAAADVPFAVAHAAPPVWWYAAAAVSLAAASMPWPAPLRAALLIWPLPLAAACPVPPDEGAYEVTFLDAGRATAVVVRTARHTLLYDTGDAYGSDGAAVEHAVLPFLRQQGIERIDALVIGSRRPKGSPGVTALLAAIPVARIVNQTAAAESATEGCGGHREWIWDGVRFALIADAPDPKVYSGACVLRIEARGGSVLLAGEIDAENERWIARSGAAAGDIVLVPRGASSSGSTPELVAAARARWAVVSGRRSTASGEERPAVLRWLGSGACVVATADAGALRFVVDGERGVVPPRAMRDGPRLWRGPRTDPPSKPHACPNLPFVAG